MWTERLAHTRVWFDDMQNEICERDADVNRLSKLKVSYYVSAPPGSAVSTNHCDLVLCAFFFISSFLS